MGVSPMSLQLGHGRDAHATLRLTHYCIDFAVGRPRDTIPCLCSDVILVIAMFRCRRFHWGAGSLAWIGGDIIPMLARLRFVTSPMRMALRFLTMAMRMEMGGQRRFSGS